MCSESNNQWIEFMQKNQSKMELKYEPECRGYNDVA